MKSIYFLAIETSCDDTAIAVMRAVESGNKLKKIEALSNVISSQTELHAGYGGVYPFLAKREHQKNLPVVFEQATEGSPEYPRGATKGFNLSKLEFIAVTHGPGLDPCLWAGINFARDLAKKYHLPLAGANHLEAHFLANLITLKISEEKFAKNYLPAVCMVVSGGHTLLFLASAIGDYKLLGQTVDDAAGECFDKAARILGLGYPGGPEIAKLASAWVRPTQACVGLTHASCTQNIDQPDSSPRSSGSRQKSACRGSLTSTIYIEEIKLPRPMMHQKNYNFSFSGLKTAVLYDFQKRSPEIAQSDEYKIAMSHEIQQAIVDVLVSKTARAAKEFAAKSIIIGGGASANLALRQAMQQTANDLEVQFLAPSVDLSVDNAAMAGVAGYFAFRRGGKAITSPDDLISEPNLGI